MNLTIAGKSAIARPFNSHMRKLTYTLILAALAACQSHKGIITKQWYEPPQTSAYVRKSGKVGRYVQDDADFCLEVKNKRSTHVLYLGFERWRTSHIGDTITYTPADRRDRPRQTPWKK